MSSIRDDVPTFWCVRYVATVNECSLCGQRYGAIAYAADLPNKLASTEHIIAQ